MRRKNLRPRVLALLAGAAVALAFARPTALTLCAGLLVAGAGAGLRLWAAGYLVKTDRLTVEGPYAHLRHPLYLGSLLIGSGLLVAAGWRVAAWGLPIGLALFFVYYLPYKERVESSRLEARHGVAFRRYREEVPLLLPRRHRFAAEGGGGAWSFDHVVENDELGTSLAVLVAFAVLAIVALALH